MCSLCNQLNSMRSAWFRQLHSLAIGLGHAPDFLALGVFWRSGPEVLSAMFFLQALAVKRPRQLITATTVVGTPFESRLPFITDSSTGFCFLMDAEIRVIPRLVHQRLKQIKLTLQAASNNTITWFGPRSLTVDLVLRRRFQCTFIQASVKTAIIGADFISV